MLCLIRDGDIFVEPFIEHYRALGAGHIVFLDNGSTDATVELASRYSGVTVLRTELSFVRYALLMKHYLIERYGRERWSLLVDADELFDYPYSDVVGLGELLVYLSSRGYTAMPAVMLDMFPRGALDRSTGESGDLRRTHRFYDLSGVSVGRYGDRQRRDNVLAEDTLPTFSGGIRREVFGANPLLTKHPLVFYTGGMRPIANSVHHVSGARIADTVGVLYHYKFVGRIYDYTERAAANGMMRGWRNAIADYKQVLDNRESLQISGPTSRELGGTRELVEGGLLPVSEDYLEFVTQKDSGDSSRDRARRREAAAGAAKRRGKRLGERGEGGAEPEKVRPLFICGCQCSGTTAFAHYLNQHQRVLVGQERYRRLSPESIGPGLFSVGRMLDYRQGEAESPEILERKRREHEELIAGKEPSGLRWIGDKNPGYVRSMGLLAAKNPGARFIVVHRPVEEVAESFESRSKDPRYHWFSQGYGFEEGVKFWNRALREVRAFAEGGGSARLLVVDYHGFFSDPASYAPSLGRFLGVEIPAELTERWRRMSEEFRRERRGKSPLTGGQRRYLSEHADREVEAWMLQRIERQRKGQVFTPGEQEALLSEVEASAWGFARRVEELEWENRRQHQRIGHLEEQLKGIARSRTWRLLDGANRLLRRAHRG